MAYCDHHPVSHARWLCPNCQMQACDQCVVAPANREIGQPFCALCNVEMDYQPNKQDLVPFWNRLGDFFRYPIQWSPLIIIALSIVSALAPANLAGLAVAVGLLLIQTKYGYKVIERVSKGRFEAPTVVEVITDPNYVIVFKQTAIIVLMIVLIFAMAYVHPILGMLGAGFFVLALPMSIIVLALEGRVADALNPLTLFISMARIGWSYLLVYLYLILMSICAATVTQIVFDAFGTQVAQITSASILLYFLLVMYSLMGYMIYQFRFELQLGPARQDLKVRQPANMADPKIHIYLLKGNYAAALDLLEKSFKKDGFNLSLLEKYLKVVEQLAHWRRVVNNQQLLFSLMLQEKQLKLLTQTAKKMFHHEPEAEIGNTQLAIDMTLAMIEEQEYQLAFRTIKNQHKFCTHTGTRNAALDVFANLLIDHFQKPDLADQVLKLKGQPVPSQLQ